MGYGRGRLRGLPVAERLRLQLATPNEQGCIEFIGTRDRDGYGNIYYIDRVIQAHRLAWILVHGPLERGQMVLHRCDNPPCCNIEHLWLGDALANNEDMRAKQRERYPSGPDHYKAAITHCKNGHPFDSVIHHQSGPQAGRTSRRCKTCARDAQRRVRARKSLRGL